MPPNMASWASFHNGVAAGLKIAPASQIDSAWIVYNKPKHAELANEYAGFLMALGLNGHLTKLATLNIHDYLTKVRTWHPHPGIMPHNSAALPPNCPSCPASFLHLYAPLIAGNSLKCWSVCVSYSEPFSHLLLSRSASGPVWSCSLLQPLYYCSLLFL